MQLAWPPRADRQAGEDRPPPDGSPTHHNVELPKGLFSPPRAVRGAGLLVALLYVLSPFSTFCLLIGVANFLGAAFDLALMAEQSRDCGSHASRRGHSTREGPATAPLSL